MQFKKAIAAVALVLNFTAFAQANQYQGYFGVLDFDNSLSYQSGNSPTASGEFNDWFTFTVADNVLAADMTARVVLLNGSINFDVQDLQIAVYKGFSTENTIVRLSNQELLDSFAVVGSGTTVSGTFTFDPTWAEYTFLISGKTTGSSATYSFGLTAASVPATPIPEPSAYVMMLAGLGLIGVVVRRRKV
jgi:hypothetical protein